MALRISNISFTNQQVGNLNNRIYTDCSFSTVTFGSVISLTTFERCFFLNTPLSNISLRNVIFRNCIFTNNPPIFSESILDTVRFDNTNIRNAKFISSRLSNISFHSMNLSEADFTNANLQHVTISNTNLSNAILKNLYSRNLLQSTTLLPSDWRVISISRNNNILIGPTANLETVKMENINLNHMNLYGVNFSNSTLINVSFEGTNLSNAVFKNVTSSGITGTPRILPIGTVIFNKIIYYTQDDINLPQITLSSPNITLNQIVPTTISDVSKNLIFCGILQNSEQHLLVYLSQDYFNPSAFESNTVIIRLVDTNTFVSSFQIPNFFITTLSPQTMAYAKNGFLGNTGKGGMLIGYGYQNSVENNLKYITIRIDPDGHLDTLYYGTGYKIHNTHNNLYPSGNTETIFHSENLYYVTPSEEDTTVVTKLDFVYAMDCSGIDFSGKNLSGIDLSGRNFTNCDFSGTNLSYSDLTNANLTNANIYRTNLSYSILSNVILTGATFFNPNLTGIYLSSQTSDFILPNGFKFVNGYFIGPGLNLDGIDLSGANLSNVNFRGSTLRKTILTNTTVLGTDFTNAVLENTITGGMKRTPILPNNYKLINGYIVGPYMNLKNANLSNIDLSNMNLYGSNLTNADLSGVILNNTSSGAIIGEPILSPNTRMINGYIIGNGVLASGADLSGGDLTDVDISDANLIDANFYNVKSRNIIGIPKLSTNYNIIDGYLIGPYVNISGLDLSGMNLSNISLYGADVNGTDLRNTDLFGLSSGGLRGTPILNSQYKLFNQYIVGPNVDLSGGNLSNVDISGMNIDGTNLSNVDFTNIRSGFVRGTPLLSSDYRLLRGYIVGRKVNLVGANLEYQNFSDMDLYQTDFTDAKLNHSKFHRTFIFDTNFTNIEFENISSSDLVGLPSHLPSELKIIDGYVNGKASRMFVGPSIRLENIEFRDQNLDDIDLSESDLINVYFNNTTINSTNFNRAKLFGIRSQNVSGLPLHLSPQWNLRNGYLIGPNANLMSSDFTNIDLSGLNLSNVNLLNVKFENTIPGPFVGQPILDFDWKLLIDNPTRIFIIGPGMNLSMMDLSNQNLTNFNLSNTILHNTNLSHTILRNVSSGGIKGNTTLLPPSWSLIGGYLIGPTANLSNSNLSRLNLSNMNLQNANLSNSNMNGTNLTGSYLNGVKSGGIRGIPLLPPGWRLVNGYLVGPQADVTGADLTDVDLSGIDLSGTNLSRANLTNVNLTNTNVTNAIFLGANLSNITPSSIYESIDLTGAILPLNNYRQYNHFISKEIRMSDYMTMRYSELKERVFKKIFSNQDVRKDINLSLVKRVNLNLYNDLYILYTESSNGVKDENYFQTLTLLDVDMRFQMYQRTLRLINNMGFIDDFLLRLMNRFDIETIPELIMRNINFSLVLPETASMFYMKHLLNERFHNMILNQDVVLEKVKNFFRATSKIYDDNLFVKNLYGVTNNTIHPSYLNIVQKYRYQVEIFENYLYSEDIVDRYTNANKISTLFRKMVDLDKKYVTPVVFSLFKKMISNIFGPFSQRDDFDLYKLNENRLFISYEFEKHLVSEFITKNTTLVQSIFDVEPNLSLFWSELNRNSPDIYILKNIYSWIDTLDTAIVYFRRQIFQNVKLITYTYVYPSDVTETILTMRDNKLDSMMNMNDENIDVVSEYLKDNSYVQRILQNPQQFIDDIKAPNFTSVKDITKLYSLSLYSTSETREKMIRYDIRLKLDENETRYVELFSGLRSDIRGDENLIAPLEEYRRIWNIIMT